MEEKTKIFAIVELFGHTQLAATLSEYTFAGFNYIRADVPETDKQPGFSRMINPSSVYAINPVTEEVMLAMAERLNKKPLESWDIREMHKKLLALNGSTISEAEQD